MQKLYCYIDETGQDTQGELYITGVIVTGTERDDLITILEDIERTSGKGNVKWVDARKEARTAYIRTVLQRPAFKGKLFYTTYHQLTNYLELTILTTARAILARAQGDYKATVFVDGLQDSLIHRFGTELRHLRVRTKKVRGVRKDETDALIRLADALCGLVRAATMKRDLQRLLDKAKAEAMYGSYKRKTPMVRGSSLSLSGTHEYSQYSAVICKQLYTNGQRGQ
jgi:hypothetical protein